MNATQTYASRIRGQLGVSLFKNSFFIILNKLLISGTGFVFWLLAARFYSTGDVGLAVALISSASLIMQFSLMGFDYSIIRFFSKYDKSKLFNTCLILTTALSLVLGLGYIAFVQYFSPSLAFIQTPLYGAIFIGYVCVSMGIWILSNTFIAARKAEYSFLQNLLLTLRVPLLLPMAFMGALGILTTVGIAYVVAGIVALYLISRFIDLKPQIDTEFVRQSVKFSFGNYTSQLLLNGTYQVLPILILNVLGETESAKYFIAYNIGNILMQIPDAVGMSLLVEGSHGESMKKNVIRAAVAIYAVLVPALIFVYFFGSDLLGLFGKDYSESEQLLLLFGIASLLFAVYCMMAAIQNVRMNVKRIIQVNAIFCVLFMSMSYIFMQRFGITGVGYALVLTYVVVDLVIIGFARKDHWI